MCANFRGPGLVKLVEWSFAITDRLQQAALREDVYPMQAAPVITSQDPNTADLGAFGLVPHWAEPKLGRMTYNARSETVASKPSFRSAWRNAQLAAIPVQAFYEPCYETGKAVRHSIGRKDGEPFFLAGLYERRMDDPGITRLSFTMITISGSGHPIMQRMHGTDDEKRSVVVLSRDQVTDWLYAKDPNDRMQMLKPFDADEFEDRPAPRK